VSRLLAGDWTMAAFVDRAVARIRAQVGPRAGDLRPVGRRRLVGRRGLIHRAIGDRLTCIFVDNGLLRAGERERGRGAFPRPLPHPCRSSTRASASSAALAGVTDPEQKRKIIGGHVFIDVFEDEAKKIDGAVPRPRARSIPT
jgi:GMP synthase (glutamine-hydrolysing)